MSAVTLVALGFWAALAYGQPEPKTLKCRVGIVKLKNQSVDKEGFQEGQCEESYWVACDEAVTKLDGKCAAACGKFRKREFRKRGTGGQLEPPCKANPVDASIDDYDNEYKKLCSGMSPRPDGSIPFKVSCSASAVCTCDP